MFRNLIERILSTLGGTIVCALIVLAFLNQKIVFIVDYFWGKMEMNFLLFTLCVMALFGFGMVLIFQSILMGYTDNIKKQSRKNEKMNITAEEAEDKVKRLEAKILTLEVALQKALKGEK